MLKLPPMVLPMMSATLPIPPGSEVDIILAYP